jgi:hypothetical protein
MARKGIFIPVILHEPDEEYAQKRIAEYPTLDRMIVALWESVVEEKMAAMTQLEVQRQTVKTKYPKDA